MTIYPERRFGRRDTQTITVSEAKRKSCRSMTYWATGLGIQSLVFDFSSSSRHPWLVSAGLACMWAGTTGAIAPLLPSVAKCGDRFGYWTWYGVASGFATMLLWSFAFNLAGVHAGFHALEQIVWLDHLWKAPLVVGQFWSISRNRLDDCAGVALMGACSAGEIPAFYV